MEGAAGAAAVVAVFRKAAGIRVMRAIHYNRMFLLYFSGIRWDCGVTITLHHTTRAAFFMADWFVYILECDKSSLYTGVNTDVERRYREHLGGGVRSAK